MVIVKHKLHGKDRPRFYRGIVFTPKATKDYELLVKQCYVEQDNRAFRGATGIRIEIYHKVPKSYPKSRLERIREGKEIPEKKPDIDNIIKIILDGLNKVAFADDTQVVEVISRKYWTEEDERVEFELYDLEP